LLLGSETGKWRVDVDGENRDESPYVQMTTRLLERFPRQGGAFQIEPDASGGSYFWAIAPGVTVKHWPASGWQIDQHFAPLAARLFAESSAAFEVSRQTDLGDSIMTAIVLAAVLGRHARFTDLGRLRLQECERVVALRTELTRCGAAVHETGDTLTLEPSVLHGADIQTYNDHRMAMCFAVVGLAVPGIRIQHPACVKKTFPNFFEKLAAPPPFGLGALIREPASGRVLVGDDLFAD
jgi:3-phosphoshikimate 1-carboxyvinyltransferase